MDDSDQAWKVFKEQVRREMEGNNASPVADFEGLSPNEMSQLLYRPLEEGSPVQYESAVTNETLGKLPFFRLFRIYLEQIDKEGELKLTARGNLPRKLVRGLYETKLIPEDVIESGIVKLNKEADSIVIQNLKLIGDLSGITKRRNNKLSLTKKGENWYHSEKQFELFKQIFETNILKFNLGYHDGYPQEGGVQQVLPYTLYLLLKFGGEQRTAAFYGEKVLTAFPHLLRSFGTGWSPPEDQFQRCYRVRTHERCLAYYGFVEVQGERFSDDIQLRDTELLRKTFQLRTTG